MLSPFFCYTSCPYFDTIKGICATRCPRASFIMEDPLPFCMADCSLNYQQL
jgi:hypothetical protein